LEKKIIIMKNNILLFLIICFGGIAVGQDFSKAGTAAGQFLKIPVGAKAVSMAGTFTSVSDDISTLYWNPAGAIALDQFEIGVSHNSWIAGISHNFIGVVLPMKDNGTIGFSVNQLGSGDIEMTTIESPSGTGTFYSTADLALSLSYAKAIMEQVSVGVSAKYINQRIANTSAQTVAFDLGILLRTGFYGMKMGLAFQNFGPALKMNGSDLIKTVDLDPNSEINPVVEANLVTQSYSLPASYRVSLSMPLIGQGGLLVSEMSSLLFAVDGVHLIDNPEHFSIGTEYGFAKTLFLRGGYVFNTDEEGLTLGAGVNLNAGSTSFTFDYAYAAFGIFSAVHVVSIGIQL
jgi:hypothetical protein